MLGLPWSARRAARSLGEDPADVARLTRVAVAGAVVWLAVTTIVARTGLGPARLIWMTVSASTATLISAFSAFGARIARGLSPRLFVGFQSFRMVTALVVPGALLDFVAGAAALGLGVGLARVSPRTARIAIAAWSAVAFLTLVVSIVRAARESSFLDYPACQVPLVALPAALFGHAVAFRWLRSGSSSAGRKAPFSPDVCSGRIADPPR